MSLLEERRDDRRTDAWSSRVFGFARDILLARVLGAGGVADAWQLAFQLPNLFRRLFAEGAFASAFRAAVSTAT